MIYLTLTVEMCYSFSTADVITIRFSQKQLSTAAADNWFVALEG